MALMNSNLETHSFFSFKIQMLVKRIMLQQSMPVSHEPKTDERKTEFGRLITIFISFTKFALISNERKI